MRTSGIPITYASLSWFIEECHFTGSGKMICATYGVLVLQKVFRVPRGVVLMTQPLRYIELILLIVRAETVRAS